MTSWDSMDQDLVTVACGDCGHNHVCRRLNTTSNMAIYEPSADPAVEWLRGQLSRYGYKPGVTWNIEHAGLTPFRVGTHALRVNVRVPDSRSSSRRLIPITFTQGIPELISDLRVIQEPGGRRHEFKRFLRGALETFEIHELREWFRCDGELVDDPHAPGARP